MEKNNDVNENKQIKIEEPTSVVMPHKKKKIVIDKNYQFGPKNKVQAFFWYLIWSFVLFFVKIYDRAILGLKIKGKKNLRETKKKYKNGIITVSNHMHMMDSIMIADIVSPYKVGFTSIQANFDIPFIGKLIKILGCVPIPDEVSKMRYFFSYITKRLKTNKVIHFFPEGMLRPYCSELFDFSKGAFVQAYRNDSAIVPIVFAQRKAKGIFKYIKQKRCCFTAYILEPQFIDKNLPKREAVKKLQDNVKKVMDETLKKFSDNVVVIDYSNFDYNTL